MITREQAGALATLLRTIRPAWDQLATINALGQHQGRDLADLAYAAIRTAQDPDSRTPAALGFTDRDHWQRTARTTPRSPKADETCPVDGHSGWAANCPQCRADRLAAPRKEIA